MRSNVTAALVREPGGKFSFETVELDDVGPREVLIRLEASGVCRTDVMGQYIVALPAVLGHEGAGVVEEVGSSVIDFKPGDRVMMSWPACGECPSCASGHRHLCDAINPLMFGGARLDGSHTVKHNGQWVSSPFFQQSSFASHAITPANSLVHAPDEIPMHLLAALTCGLMTGAGSVMNTLGAGARDQMAVFGAGAVGLSAVMAARIVGADPIIAVDLNDERLALALELGATHAFNAAQDDVPARVRDVAPRGVSCALDTTGMDSTWRTAIQCLGMGGTLGAVHVPAGEMLQIQATELIARAAQFKFILSGSSVPRVFLPQLISWYRKGLYPFDRLVSTFDFADINLAFEESAAGRAVKPVLLMS
ncbi:MAG: NAD(P)-dependent alcohol dehydrogenase [Actinobacteria bacterium]|nr:NAD(P)-dependent alcohol dehydrogenase [Actinomycetota bacterium]